jgi:hypothetical protein
MDVLSFGLVAVLGLAGKVNRGLQFGLAETKDAPAVLMPIVRG